MREGQSLTPHVFVVRRCLSEEGKPGSDDRIVRSFDLYHDASCYADLMNDGHMPGTTIPSEREIHSEG